jgi:hypothetical protein
LSHASIKEAKNIGNTQEVPEASQQFPNYAPHELCHGAGKEDMVYILPLPTESTLPRRWTMPMTSIVTGRKTFPNQLPKEHPNL